MWRKGQNSFSRLYGYSVVPASYIEKFVLSHNSARLSVSYINFPYMHVSVPLFCPTPSAVYSVPLVYFSTTSPVLHSLNYYSFTIYLIIGRSSPTCLFFLNRASLSPLHFDIKCRIRLPNFTKKKKRQAKENTTINKIKNENILEFWLGIHWIYK